MIEMKFFRADVLPAELENNAFYMIRNPATGALEITATGATGLAVSSLTHQEIIALIAGNNAASADKLATGRTISATGDGTWEVTFDGSQNETGVLTLANTGVVAGEYSVVTVDAKGRVTASRALAAADIPALPGSKITSALSVDTSGNAATATLAAAATKLANPVNINGVAFDGSAPITINAVDSTARIAVSEKGVANGVATLNEEGLIPTSQLPSFVDDVIEVTAYDELPGELNDVLTNGAPAKGKIYVVAPAGGGSQIYRWSGSTYIQIPEGMGTADTAVKLATARKIAATGDATWEVTFDGSNNVTSALTLADTGIVAGTYAGITFDSKGRAVEARALIEADIPEITSTVVLSSRTVDVTGDWGV